ncbi:MAG TPA: YciI family protein [Eoetvoesiella sp.]
MLYIIYQEDRDDGAAAIRAEVKPAHLKYLAQHERNLVLGGAMLAEDGVKRTGSVLILNVGSYAEAEKFSLNEPFRKAGLFKDVRISRMRRGQWNPAAAPSTPEGN